MKTKYLVAALAAAAGFALAVPKIDDARIDQVLHELNNETDGHGAAAQYAGTPPAQLRASVEKSLQVMDALRGEALKMGLDKQPEIHAEWQNMEARFYAEKYAAYLAEKAEVGEEELRRAYDEQTRVLKIQQVRFDTAEQAKAAQQLLLKGLSFEELMKRYPNQDQQMQDFVTLNDLTPEIAEAVAPMKRGEVSIEPVEYQQRFYLLKVAADERNPEAPPFAQVKAQLLQQAKQQKAQEEILEWLKANGIEAQ